MTFIALVVLGMAARGVRCGNVGALQRILFAAWAGADNAGGRARHSLRGRFHNTRVGNSGCGTVGVGVHAVQIVKIPVAAIGSRPIIGVERHGRFRVADDVGDIEGIARIRFPPESVLTNAFQNRFAIVHGDRVQLRAAIKGVCANDRSQRQFGGGQRRASLKPICQI